MPLKRKAVWYCCPRDAQVLNKSYVEVSCTENEETEFWCFGFKLTKTEGMMLKYCPSCGTAVPTTQAILTLEGLTDNEKMSELNKSGDAPFRKYDGATPQEKERMRRGSGCALCGEDHLLGDHVCGRVPRR